MPSSSEPEFCDAAVEPTTCGGTTRPFRSMKNVSGVPVTPNYPAFAPSPSATLWYFTP